jgi:hypothetical protein
VIWLLDTNIVIHALNGVPIVPDASNLVAIVRMHALHPSRSEELISAHPSERRRLRAEVVDATICRGGPRPVRQRVEQGALHGVVARLRSVTRPADAVGLGTRDAPGVLACS